MLQFQNLIKNFIYYKHQLCYIKKVARWATKRALDVLDVERIELLNTRRSEQQASGHFLYKKKRDVFLLGNIVQDFVYIAINLIVFITQRRFYCLDIHLCLTPL